MKGIVGEGTMENEKLHILVICRRRPPSDPEPFSELHSDVSRRAERGGRTQGLLFSVVWVIVRTRAPPH